MALSQRMRSASHVSSTRQSVHGLDAVPSRRVRNARWSRKAFVASANAVAVKEAAVVVTEEVLKKQKQEYNMGLGDISKTVLSIILGGGAGSRLYPLTKKRAKPAVPLGANYRLIDIPVSNCLNSNINRIYCLTQFNSASLNRHLSQAYNSTQTGSTGFVEVLAASQSNINKNWFQGTADAVRQYMWLFEQAMYEGVEEFLILSGDHLYRMDYRSFIKKHRDTGAAITIAVLPCDEKRATSFGLMKIDGKGQVTEFSEKPKGEALNRMRVDTSILGCDAAAAKAMPFIASMGIYVINATVLKDLLLNQMPDANDFGNEIIPGAQAAGLKVQAHLFEGYWEDIGTIDSFYRANLALTNPATAAFKFFDKEAPIYTMSRYLPPSKVLAADLFHTVIGDGCIIKQGAKIKNSVIGLRSLIGQNVVIEDSLIMGSDYYETLEECAYIEGCLPMGISDNTIVRKAIIDKNARIGPNCQIINKDNIKEANRESDGFIIKDHIIVVVKDTIMPAGTII